MGKFLQGVKHELAGMMPAVIFFFIAFQLLALTSALVLEEYGVHSSTFIAATVGALVVAKVVLIIDMLPVVNRFPDKPLIYNVLWKTAIYFIAALLVSYAEHLFDFLGKYDGLLVANEHLLKEVVWPHFWVIQLWLLVLLFMYCSLRELIRVLGRDRIRAIFLGSNLQH